MSENVCVCVGEVDRVSAMFVNECWHGCGCGYGVCVSERGCLHVRV